jgi:hypothetical protein
MGIEIHDLCEETVVKNGQDTQCGKPLNATGGCEYARKHKEE